MTAVPPSDTLTVLIPAYNEAGNIEDTVKSIVDALEHRSIPFEILMVVDKSTDGTEDVCTSISGADHRCRMIYREDDPGIGLSISDGLKQAQGGIIAIMMADKSDSAEDLLRCYDKIREGYDCVFGSRWMKGGEVLDYPLHKYVLNRLGNNLIRLLFWISYDDVTNAFKLYRREVVEGIRPLLSYHFNILAEMPLKAIVRGYNYAVIPISWRNRKHGMAKLKIREMGSRYMFIILYALLEKLLSRQDYVKK